MSLAGSNHAKRPLRVTFLGISWTTTLSHNVWMVTLLVSPVKKCNKPLIQEGEKKVFN